MVKKRRWALHDEKNLKRGRGDGEEMGSQEEAEESLKFFFFFFFFFFFC